MSENATSERDGFITIARPRITTGPTRMSGRDDHSLFLLIRDVARLDRLALSATEMRILRDAILADGYRRRPRTIEPGPEQEAELEALPVGTVLRAKRDGFAQIAERRDLRSWSFTSGRLERYSLARDNVTWTVLYTPEVDQ